jgi:hypothetical protein
VIPARNKAKIAVAVFGCLTLASIILSAQSPQTQTEGSSGFRPPSGKARRISHAPEPLAGVGRSSGEAPRDLWCLDGAIVSIMAFSLSTNSSRSSSDHRLVRRLYSSEKVARSRLWLR